MIQDDMIIKVTYSYADNKVEMHENLLEWQNGLSKKDHAMLTLLLFEEERKTMARVREALEEELDPLIVIRIMKRLGL